MRIVLFLLSMVLAALPAQAQARFYEPAELDALVAPVALQPDPVLWNVLAASTTPAELVEAAAWSRANPGLAGEEAVRAVQGFDWQPAVKALVAYPELLQRMAESPQWTFDLGTAYLEQRDAVLAAVQAMRERAYANGGLRSDGEVIVQRQGPALAVVPAVSYYHTIRYYDPFLVYGPAWIPAYRPVLWRPWPARVVYVPRVVVVRNPPPHRPHVVHSHPHPRIPPNGQPSPAARMQAQQSRAYVERYHRVPESQRQPIVQSRTPPAFREPRRSRRD